MLSTCRGKFLKIFRDTLITLRVGKATTTKFMQLTGMGHLQISLIRGKSVQKGLVKIGNQIRGIFKTDGKTQQLLGNSRFS
ncbi:Uncharacterised protein [Vibrio cholerae]|nr:Uncharacterised protein [Vibrio cholerae]